MTQRRGIEPLAVGASATCALANRPGRSCSETIVKELRIRERENLINVLDGAVMGTVSPVRRAGEVRPGASYRRFVCLAPNACWQLDATEYVMTVGASA